MISCASTLLSGMSSNSFIYNEIIIQIGVSVEALYSLVQSEIIKTWEKEWSEEENKNDTVRVKERFFT